MAPAEAIISNPENDRWGRRLGGTVACAAALLGVLCVGWPPLASRVLPWPLPPLHARCVGVMHLALALQWLAALRPLDPHTLRMPMLASAGWGLAGAAGLLLQAGPGGLGRLAAAWVATWLLLAGAALALLSRPTGIRAVAERPGRAWYGVALAATATSVLLLARPAQAVAVWPWTLTPALAAGYAGPFLAFGVMAWCVARERRQYVRRPAQQSLALLGAGVLASGLLHWTLFDFHRPAAWVWFLGFAAVTALALHPFVPAIRTALRHAWPAPPQG